MEYILYIILFICLLGSAFFSATETAFSSVNRIRLKNLAEEGNKKAKLAIKLSENYDQLISTILIGNNIVNILGASMATIICIKSFGNELGPTISTVAMTIIVLVFGEVTPKSIAKERAESFAMHTARILRFFIFIFAPLNFLFRQWKKFISLFIKKKVDQGITDDELISIVEEAENDGNIEKEDTELIRSAIEFREQVVGDIFTPRFNVVALEKNSPIEEIQKAFLDTGYSRLPIYENDFDNIIGILYYKDFFKQVSNNEFDISSIIKPVLFVTKNQNIKELLAEFQEQKIHFAIIVDELGIVSGIVTMEDILEELVGEIWDEHDEVTEDIEETDDGEFYVSGQTNIEKFFEFFDIEEEPSTLTVNGWIMEKLKHIPSIDTTFENEVISLRIVKMNGRRVDKIAVKKLEVEE